MKKGDLVEVTMNWKRPPSVRYIVRVREITERGISGPYAWQPDGKLVMDLGRDGAFRWNEIDEVKTLEFLDPQYNDGDVVKGVHNTYEKFGGKWYMQTQFTDATIETVKNPNKEPGAEAPKAKHPYTINVFSSADSREMAAEVSEELQRRGTSMERGPDGDWCGR
jgi:hypothetical protein